MARMSASIMHRSITTAAAPAPANNWANCTSRYWS